MAFESPLARAIRLAGQFLGGGLEQYTGIRAQEAQRQADLDREQARFDYQIFLQEKNNLVNQLQSALSEGFLDPEKARALELELSQVQAAQTMNDLNAARVAEREVVSTTAGTPLQIMPEGTRRLGVPSISVRTTEPTTAGALAAEATRGARRAQVAYERELVQEERDFILQRDELQNLYQIKRDEGNQAFERRLQELAQQNNIDIETLRNEFQTARDQNLFEQELTYGEQATLNKQLSDAISGYGEKGDDLNRNLLERFANDETLPAYMRNSARAALQADVSAQNAAYMGDLRVQIEEGKQAELNTDLLEQALQLGELDITIAGQTIAMNGLEIQGQELVNARTAFENEALQFETGADYVSRAVTLGMPERIQTLIDVKNSGDVNDPLWSYVENASLAELNEALDTAIQAKDLAGRERSVALAEAQRAGAAAFAGQLVDVAGLVESMASAYSPEELDGLTQNGGSLARLIAAGAIDQNDVDAMKRKSSLYRVVEMDEVNGPRMAVLQDRLNQWADPTKFPNVDDPESLRVAQDGLRTTLNNMVELGYMELSEVEGLVEVYTNAWRNADDATELALAEARAQLNVLNSQEALNRARAVDAAEGEPLVDTAWINANRELIETTIGLINDKARLSGCLDDAGAVLNVESCANFQLQLDEQFNNLIAMTNQMGFTTLAPGQDPSGMMIREIDRLLNRGDSLSNLEVSVLESYIEAFGGEDEIMRLLGFDDVTLDEAPPPAPAPVAPQGTQGGGGGVGGAFRAAGEAVGAAAERAGEAVTGAVEETADVLGTGASNIAEGASEAFGPVVGAIGAGAQAFGEAGAGFLEQLGERARYESPTEPGVPAIPFNLREVATPISAEQVETELRDKNLTVETLQSDVNTLLALREEIVGSPSAFGTRTPSASQNARIASLMLRYGIPGYEPQRWNQFIQVLLNRYGNVLQ